MAGSTAGETTASRAEEVAIIVLVTSFYPRIAAASLGLVVLIVWGGTAPLHAFREDTENDLLPRIQREHDPVKRAKFEIRLAHLKLLRGIEACEKDDDEECHKLLNAYLDLLKSSWKDLQASGRNAVKQPAGFKELDIALREDTRSLDDGKRKMPLEDRDPADAVIQQVEKLHEEVLGVLFPSGAARPTESKPVPHAESHFAAGRVE